MSRTLKKQIVWLPGYFCLDIQPSPFKNHLNIYWVFQYAHPACEEQAVDRRMGTVEPKVRRHGWGHPGDMDRALWLMGRNYSFWFGQGGGMEPASQRAWHLNWLWGQSCISSRREGQWQWQQCHLLSPCYVLLICSSPKPTRYQQVSSPFYIWGNEAWRGFAPKKSGSSSFSWPLHRTWARSQKCEGVWLTWRAGWVKGRRAEAWKVDGANEWWVLRGFISLA